MKKKHKKVTYVKNIKQFLGHFVNIHIELTFNLILEFIFEITLNIFPSTQF